MGNGKKTPPRPMAAIEKRGERRTPIAAVNQTPPAFPGTWRGGRAGTDLLHQWRTRSATPRPWRVVNSIQLGRLVVTNVQQTRLTTDRLNQINERHQTAIAFCLQPFLEGDEPQPFNPTLTVTVPPAIAVVIAARMYLA
jgi:hypothetical protein